MRQAPRRVSSLAAAAVVAGRWSSVRRTRQFAADRLRVGGIDYASAEHAVQLIHPHPLPGADGRSVVLNSGHTCRDDERRFSSMVFPRLGDWAVTKVGEQPADAAAATVAEEVIVSGFCDESWRLP